MQARNPILFRICGWLLCLCVSCGEQTKKDRVSTYASLSDSTRYTGIQSCRPCHEDKFQSFIKTGMGMSFDSATRKKSSATFHHKAIYDPHKDFYYLPYWSSDSMFVKEFRLDGRDTIFQRTEKIKYIIGSGQHTNSHMMEVNGYITQVPITFYTQKAKWDLPPGFENGFNSRFSRKIELECMSCHNSFPSIVPGSENKYESIPNGIDCERCHGPGADHIRLTSSGNVVDVTREIDYSIVNPAKLPINEQLDVCQRCHIQGNVVLKEGKSFYDFRPGMKLKEVMDVYMPAYKDEESKHIMASHAERMKQSACYFQSMKKAEAVNPNKSALYPYKNALTCVTCHNPHVSVKETDSGHFNNACTGCHIKHATNIEVNEVAKTDLACSADKTERNKKKDNCVACHMPKNSTIDIPHVSSTDHYIRKPIPQKDMSKIREFVTLLCINNPDADFVSRGNAFLNFFEKFEPRSLYLLDSAKKYFPDANDQDLQTNIRSLIRYAYLKNDYSLVVKYVERAGNLLSRLNRRSYSNDDAWTNYRIGESYQMLDNKMKAIDFLQNAVTLEPFNPDFRNKLASFQFQLNRFEDSRKNLEFIIRENPKYASAYVSLGYLLLSVDRNVDRADKYYDVALALDPDNEQGLINKAGILIYMNKKKESRKLLLKLLKKNPDHSEGLYLIRALGNSN